EVGFGIPVKGKFQFFADLPDQVQGYVLVELKIADALLPQRQLAVEVPVKAGAKTQGYVPVRTNIYIIAAKDAVESGTDVNFRNYALTGHHTFSVLPGRFGFPVIFNGFALL